MLAILASNLLRGLFHNNLHWSENKDFGPPIILSCIYIYTLDKLPNLAVTVNHICEKKKKNTLTSYLLEAKNKY